MWVNLTELEVLLENCEYLYMNANTVVQKWVIWEKVENILLKSKKHIKGLCLKSFVLSYFELLDFVKNTKLKLKKM